MSAIGRLFVDETVRRFRAEYLPRLETAVRALPPGALWWRPHEGTNAIGNLLLHLEGNVRQWLVGGLGGGSQERARSAEFAAREGADAETLLVSLHATVEAGCRAIESTEDAELARTRTIQGFEVTGLAAAQHVLEHFAYHLGQIVWIAKHAGGEGHGIAFYDDSRL